MTYSDNIKVQFGPVKITKLYLTAAQNLD